MTHDNNSSNVTHSEILAAFDIQEDDGIDRIAERETALQALAYVLGRTYKVAEAAAEEGVFSISFKITFDRNETPTSVKAVSRCSRVSKADIILNCPQED